jgi:uncharacterized protein YjbI with pentapeptide repeats
MKHLTQRTHHSNSLARLRLGIVAALLVGGLLAAIFGAALGNDWDGIWLNLGTELMGAGLTFLLVDQLLRQRERQEAEERAAATSKAELTARLGSNVHSFAVAAAEALRRHGWLTDGSLHGVSLMTANLQGAPLSSAQLRGANLSDANLQQADLGRAVLTEASLDGANLQGTYLLAADLLAASLVGAKLGGADLREATLNGAELVLADLRQARFSRASLRQTVLSTADLRGANLQQADLRDAYGRAVDLRGADLQGANVQGARFEDVQLDEQTTLPDGTHWTAERSLDPFTGAHATHNGQVTDAELLARLLNDPPDPFA